MSDKISNIDKPIISQFAKNIINGQGRLSYAFGGYELWTAMWSRLLFLPLRLRGATCENNRSGFDLRKTQHIFFAMSIFDFRGFKSLILDKNGIINLRGTFAHDTTKS